MSNMKLIKPYFEILEQQSGLEGLYKQIELCGRVAYKSEDKITEDSAKGFVDKIIKLKHWGVLEHGTVYLKVEPTGDGSNYSDYSNLRKYLENPYSKVYQSSRTISGYYENYRVYNCYVITNLRVLVENNWLDDLKYLCEPTKYHEKRICVRFVCDRGILAEFTRHRTFSFIAESTRYCNYSKNKFGNEVTFIIPCWLDIKEVENYRHWADKYEDTLLDEFLCALQNAETSYLSLINCGWKPQQARAVLPNSLKTELIMTGFISDWKHFFELRCPESAHPQARELAIPLNKEFLRRRYFISLYDEANPD